MKLSIVIPAIVTAVLTVLAVFSAIWLMGLVPAGPWANLIKAGITVFIIGSTLLIVAWSAYFTFIVRQTMERRAKD